MNFILVVIKTYNAIFQDDGTTINQTRDQVTINLKFEDGSVGVIHYLSMEDHHSKEKLSVLLTQLLDK